MAEPEESTDHQSHQSGDPPGEKAEGEGTNATSEDRPEEEEEEEEGTNASGEDNPEEKEEEQEQEEQPSSAVKQEQEQEDDNAMTPVKKEQAEEDKRETQDIETADAAATKETNKEELSRTVGGTSIDKKAFCLLDGFFDKEGEKMQRVTVPLTRLPAVLGRSHTTGDLNFFQLGPSKALSRQHAVISFRDETGGKLITPKNSARDSTEEEKLEYEKPDADTVFKVVNLKTSTGEEGKENSNSYNKFPPRGAFVLEALGKNLVVVGKHKLKPHEFAILTPGDTIRLSSYCFHFLLPTDITKPPKTMEIPLQTTSPTASKTSKKKTAGTKRKISPSPKDMPQPKIRKPKAAPFAQLQAELDTLPIDDLLERMDEACQAEKWERRHQLIGSAISYHAVRDAAKDPAIRKVAAGGGVPRMDFLRWIKTSPKYSKWVEQMNEKMETKSYQNTITKALLKAGYERTGSGGRYIRWILPDVPITKNSEGGTSQEAEEKTEGNPDDEEDDEEEGDGNEEEDGQDQDDDDGNDQEEGDDNADEEK